MPKKITVKCYGPIAVGREHRSSWEDVWLSWTGKPGRKKYYLGPTLVSRTALEQDHQINIKCRFNDEIVRTSEVLKQVLAGNSWVDWSNPNIPTIYSPKEWIDRDEAERMIGELMLHHGFTSIRCKWKRPKMIIIPT